VALGRHHDDRHRAERWIGLEAPQHLETTDPWHHGVQHDQVGHVALGQLHGLLSVLGPDDLVAPVGELERDHVGDLLLVLGN